MRYCWVLFSFLFFFSISELFFVSAMQRKLVTSTEAKYEHIDKVKKKQSCKKSKSICTFLLLFLFYLFYVRSAAGTSINSKKKQKEYVDTYKKTMCIYCVHRRGNFLNERDNNNGGIAAVPVFKWCFCFYCP